MSDPLPRSGFRPLRVTARRQETAQVTSFFLEPLEADGWRDYQAGQFLSFRLPSTDARGKMLRNYSLASSPLQKGAYQICVKRESAATSANGGQGSGYFHEHVQVGDILYADGPRGHFTLKDNDRPTMLISAGIGITPLTGMLRVLATRSQPLLFLHECQDAASYIMRQDIMALIAGMPQAKAITFYDSENAQLSKDAIAAASPAATSDIYLCGPTPFMQRAYGALRMHGIAAERIAVEFFGPLRDLELDYRNRA